MRVQDMYCVCISLARRPDRWTRFSDQPEVAQRLPHLQRFDAVDGKKIDVVNDKRINILTRRNILYKTRRSHEEIDSVGAIGCSLSHIAVWREFLESGRSHALIFEDDAVVTPGFVAALNKALQSGDADAADLITFSRACRFKDQLTLSSGFRPVQAFILAHAYIINQKAAQTFLDEAFPLSSHIDFYMSIQCNMKGLKMAASPALMLPQAGQTSDIQTKPTCPMCDVPTNFTESYVMVPRQSWALAKGSEYLLLALTLGYVLFAHKSK